MTTRQTRTAELERLLGSDRLRRPALALCADGTAGRRDPSPTWDPWFCMPVAERRRLVRFMAPTSDPSGLELDQLATLIGAGSLEDALDAWASACRMTRVDAWQEMAPDEWEAADRQAESDSELYGPQELADRWGISIAALHQRRHREQTPEPDMTISKVPIWTGETIRLWEEWQ